jgi:hypothetical protein
MKFKKESKIFTSDLWYDIFDGGYIKPEDILDNPDDMIRLQEAIDTLKEFRNAGENEKVIEYM